MGSQLPSRGIALRGLVWVGGDEQPFDGVVVVDGAGRIAGASPSDWMPDAQLPTLGGAGCWIGPGVVDSHVHLAFDGDFVAERSGPLGPGLVGARDLGAPLRDSLTWRERGHHVRVAGPILTATDGYPSRSWGADGFARFIDSPTDAARAVRELADAGVDVVKVAIERGPGWPTPAPPTLRAAVDLAHGCGLAVVAHAVGVDAVRRALDAGVDELAHMPTQRLTDEDVERIVAAGVSVVSTLQTFFAQGTGRAAAANAVDLVAAGVVLRYGTDLGNGGTQPGVDPRELDRLADTGLGRRGALLAATLHSARAPGVGHRTGRLTVGEPANLVVLSTDPEQEPAAWRCPLATIIDGRLHTSHSVGVPQHRPPVATDGPTRSGRPERLGR